MQYASFKKTYILYCSINVENLMDSIQTLFSFLFIVFFGGTELENGFEKSKDFTTYWLNVSDEKSFQPICCKMFAFFKATFLFC